VTTRTYVSLEGKEYCVTHHRTGEQFITVQFEGFNVARRDFARQSPVYQTRPVKKNGRLGRKILAKMLALAAQQAPLRERLCTPVNIETAGHLLASNE
jgi:hypothetical protein